MFQVASWGLMLAASNSDMKAYWSNDIFAKVYSYQTKNYMRDHGSIGLPLGMGSFGGFFFRLFVCFWLFPFSVFVLREASKWKV